MNIARSISKLWELNRFGFDCFNIQMPKPTVLLFWKIEKWRNKFYKTSQLLQWRKRTFTRFHLNKGFTEMFPNPFQNRSWLLFGAHFPKPNEFFGENIRWNLNQIPQPTKNLTFPLKSFKYARFLKKYWSFYRQTEKDLQQKNSIAEKRYKYITEIAHRMLTMFAN